MDVFPINLYGDKILRNKAIPVKEIDFETVDQIKRMFDTMRRAGGMGLAANQVGLDKSMFVLDLSMVKGYEKLKPMALINPKIVSTSPETKLLDEGCLSIPNLRASVERPSMLEVIYYDTDMKEIKLEADEWLARVIFHEYDHLNGIYFTDRVNDETRRRLKKDLIEIKNRRVKTDYPITERIKE
jgi:peptide deformylase